MDPADENTAGLTVVDPDEADEFDPTAGTDTGRACCRTSGNVSRFSMCRKKAIPWACCFEPT